MREPSTAFPMLERPGELFMLVVDDHGTPTCERWTVHPARYQLIARDPSGFRTFAYEIKGHRLTMSAFYHRQGQHGRWGSCEHSVEGRETDEGLYLEGARWFRTAEACGAAIARGDRVATQLPCMPSGPVAMRDRQASRTKFEAILDHGGRMYTVRHHPDGARCTRVQLTPYAPRPGGRWRAGTLSYPIDRPGVRGVESYGYQIERGATEMDLYGPSSTIDDESSVRNRVRLELEYRTDSVGLYPTLHFTAAQCEAALATEQARASRLPAQGGIPDPRGLSSGPAAVFE